MCFLEQKRTLKLKINSQIVSMHNWWVGSHICAYVWCSLAQFTKVGREKRYILNVGRIETLKEKNVVTVVIDQDYQIIISTFEQ